MMSRGGEELIGIHGENVEAYMLDSPINNTLSAVEGSSGSDSTTLSPLPRSLYEGNHEQSLTPTVHDFSGSTTNFNHISTAHLTPLEPNSFMPDKNEFGFAGLNTVFSETNDFLHFDELPFYSPTSSIGDMSLISNSGPFALSPSLQGLGTEFMGYELNPTDDFRVEHMSHTRREDSSMGNLVTANGNFNSPTSIHSHGTSENTPVLHPQTNSRGRFACTIPGCTRSYKRYPELKRHKEIHSGVNPPYACTILRCNRRGHNGFWRKDHLRQHLKHVHRIMI